MPPPLHRRIWHYRWLLLTLACVFVLDQLSKVWVIRTIPFGTYFDPIPIVEGRLSLVHIGNSGAAWGMLQGFGMLLAMVALVTIAVIFFCRRVLFLHLLSMQLTFGCLIGGILGNLFDRVYRGYVIDFVDVNLGFYRWPAFNVADSAIFIGVALYILFSFAKPQVFTPPRTGPEPDPSTSDKIS